MRWTEQRYIETLVHGYTRPKVHIYKLSSDLDNCVANCASTIKIYDNKQRIDADVLKYGPENEVGVFYISHAHTCPPEEELHKYITCYSCYLSENVSPNILQD